MEKSKRYSAMPAKGMTARNARAIVKEHLVADATPSLNLAGYHNTIMEREIEDIMFEHLPKNITHHEAYPGSNEIEKDCVAMIAELFNSSSDSTGLTAVGTSTIGSSEAIMLAVLAAKRRWEVRRSLQGKSSTHPNMVTSSVAHVCWQKAALFLGIELRHCAISDRTLAMDPQKAIDMVDENTVLVGAVLGSSLTGTYDDVKMLNDLLIQKNNIAGLDVMIHVDAAGGGFVAPFVAPNLEWDFRFPLVCSINVSGHKFVRLTYASVGWALWRSRELLPKDLLFTVDYCGASRMVSFTLNFSKSAVNVIAQYYQLLRLGKTGYKATMGKLYDVAIQVTRGIQAIGNGTCFRIIDCGDGHALPVVLWCLTDRGCYDEYVIAHKLRGKGWIIPAYEIKTSTTSYTVLRVIVSGQEAFFRARQS
ncbi:Glutamate decarboxylase 1 [Pseudocercospora fuligena]|uniref:Glutamate decarboxylase n=1 Tax=Pseudocercospora fuligena TaxID=685502 RepID=A0A8H6RIV2_9PEZI|nr:Glutamate decarboxylase 1 [Pseudocercospora fuligena]